MSTRINPDLIREYQYDCSGMVDPPSFDEWLWRWNANWLWKEQRFYEKYWIKNVWGFGDKMRDYLLEGPRRMRLCN